MTILAIDHGTKRVGLAIGSTDAGVAAPLRVLECRDEAAFVEEIRGIVASESVDTIVIGLPISGRGEATAQSGIVRAFASRLGAALGVPTILEDERLSSREIEAHMQAMGGRKAWKASGLDRDTAAATLFLQTYLDRLKQEAGR